MQGLPAFVVNTDGSEKRQQGRKAQVSNIQAAKVCLAFIESCKFMQSLTEIPLQTVADVIRTCLGPKVRLSCPRLPANTKLIHFLLCPQGNDEAHSGRRWRHIASLAVFSLYSADSLGRLTNDGHAILREIEVAHPAAKSMLELSRTQDEECGDGTTSVIILGESLHEQLWPACSEY